MLTEFLKKNDYIIILFFYLITVLAITITIYIFYNNKSNNIESIKIESNNENNRYMAVKGNTVYLKVAMLNYSKTKPKILINGEEGLVNYYNNKNIYIAEYKIKKETDKDYEIKFEIKINNKKYKNTTDGSKVIIKSNSNEVKKVELKGIKINEKNINMKIGERKEIDIITDPVNASYKTVRWKIENSDIVTINGGDLIAKSVGTTKVTTNIEGFEDTFNVTVKSEDTNIDNNTTNKQNNNNTPSTPKDKSNNNNSSSNKPNKQNNNNASSPQKKKPNNNTVKVTGVSLDKNSQTVILNSNNTTINLNATVYPSNATNKQIIWNSSDNNIASVSNGMVTAKNPGRAVISVKTSDGGYTANFTIEVRKKIVIVIGASQVKRMDMYKKSYTSSTSGNKYNTSNGTLKYIYDSGSGSSYQASSGFNSAKEVLESNPKKYVDYYIYFPIAGNDIKHFSCSEISTNNSTMNNYASKYNSVIGGVKSNGYNVKAFVVSVQPVKASQSDSDMVVNNNNSNSCKKRYRSNVKYYTYNKAMKDIIQSKYSNNLTWESLFIQIMETNNNGTNYSYKVTYNTVDGIHWDSSTTDYYVNLMLNYSNEL